MRVPSRRPTSPSRSRRSPRPARPRSPTSPPSSASPGGTAKATFFVDGDGPARHRHRPRRPRRQRDQAGQRDRRSAACARPRSRRSRPPAWSPATARRSAPATRSSSWTTWRRAPRTSSPARTGPGSTCATSTSARDYTPDVVTDIASAREGDACPTCGEPVILRNGIEVGNIFKLGTKYTKALGAEYLGEDGGATPSSWARTASASGGTSPASSRRTTTRRASSGRPRSRRTRRTS